VFVVRCSLFVVRCLLFVTSTGSVQVFVVCCSLFVVCHFVKLSASVRCSLFVTSTSSVKVTWILMERLFYFKWNADEADLAN